MFCFGLVKDIQSNTSKENQSHSFTQSEQRRTDPAAWFTVSLCEQQRETAVSDQEDTPRPQLHESDDMQ